MKKEEMRALSKKIWYALKYKETKEHLIMRLNADEIYLLISIGIEVSKRYHENRRKCVLPKVDYTNFIENYGKWEEI
jgi:hypothetical protein